MVDVPKPLKDLWSQWDIRVFVLASLFLQMLLILFASWRKRNSSKTFSLFIWSVYLLADWVADFALGLLCNSQGQSDCQEKPSHMGNGSKMVTTIAASSKHNILSSEYNDKLLAFWAPFLLLHLGGPDTITAFAMEDNELWPRHLLGLMFEVGAAVYVFLLSIPKNTFLLPTLLMFLAGIIKYGERTYALYLASLDGFRDSMLKDPDPGPNYAKLMEEYAYKKDSGVPTRIEISTEPKEQASLDQIGPEAKDDGDDDDDDDVKVQEAHEFFNTFKGLVVELIFSFHEWNKSRTTFLKKSAEDAFRVVEFELSFVYEVLFTKAVVVHNRYGYILRAICTCSIMGAFLSFFFSSKRHHFSKLDISITYTLLVGAIFLDALAFVMLILSDWTVVNLKNSSSCIRQAISRFLLKFPPCHRWSVKITQHNLISRCIPENPTYFKRIMGRSTLIGKLDELLCTRRVWRWTTICNQLLDELQYTWRKDVTDVLKEYIFEELKKKATCTNDMKMSRQMCSCRGDWALGERGLLREFGYSVEVEFDESLLMWHIATDLCYYTEEDIGKESKDNQTPPEESSVSVKVSLHRQFCKLISDYLAYLVVMRPFMMASAAVIGQIRYRDTCAETKNFFHRRSLGEIETESEKINTACYNLLTVNTEVKPVDVKGDRSKSVLFDACILAKKLKEGMKVEKRWEVMSEVWIEMLAYAASRCPGIAHAQRLSKGGELLTFVWFLMTHLGLGEQYRIEAGYARAKLVVDK